MKVSVSSPGRWLAAIVAAALVLRLGAVVADSYPLESDEAIVGLMARHILQGERPVFYYGQPYMGAAEAYLAAGAFWLGGASMPMLRLFPLVLSLVFVYLTYAVGRRVYGVGIGLTGAAYVAVCPPFLTMWSLKARGGYIETLVLGGAIVMLTMSIVYDGRDSWRHWAGLGCLTGLALWINGLVLPYLLAVAVCLFSWRRAFFWRRGFLAFIAGLALGGAPLWAYNWQHPWATFQHLLETNVGGEPSLIPDCLRNVLNLYRFAFPVLLGVLQGTSSAERFHQGLAEAGATYSVSLVVVLVLVVGVLYRHRQTLQDVVRLSISPVRREAPLLLLLFTAPLLFIVSGVGHLHYSEPRYLLPLYSTIPIFAAGAQRLLRLPTRWQLALLASVLVFNLQGNLRVDPTLSMPVIEGKQPARSNVELARFLEARGVFYVYTDYWIAYTLAFESEERIIPSVMSTDLKVGFNRYLPYAHQVSLSANPGYVFLAGAPSETVFVAQMKREGVVSQWEVLHPYSVYYDLEPPRHLH